MSEKSIDESEKLGLAQLTTRLKELNRLAETNISGQKTKKIQSELFQFEGKCREIIRIKREVVSEYSHEMEEYWRFTCFLIGASCFFAILLSYTGYKVFSAKEKIENLQKMKSLLLNESIDVVVTCDDKGKIVEFNKAAENSFGYSIDEVVGKNVQFLYANTQQAEIVKEAINLNEKYQGEILNRRKNGEIFISQLSANRLLNEKGKMIGSMGISRDISKEKALATNFESIVNNVADIVYSCDMHGNFTFVNKAIVDILGYSEEEMIGIPFFEIIHEDQIARVMEKYTNQYLKREPVSYATFQVKKKDGSYIWISQSVRLVMSETHKGHVVGVHGIARNVEGITELPKDKV
jgi:PAS domain S-box-containing protein